MFKNKMFSNKADKAAKQEPVFKQDYFNNCHRTYSCIHCRAHLANHDELISKLFQGNHGRAYLFNKVVNIGCKQAVQRELLTGLHAVADIYCDSCETTLGWKYEQAFVPSQKYKEGKYIIELVHMLKENNWDPTSYNARELLEEETKITINNNDGNKYNKYDNSDNFKVGGGRNLVVGGLSNYEQDCNNEVDRRSRYYDGGRQVISQHRVLTINLGEEIGTSNNSNNITNNNVQVNLNLDNDKVQIETTTNQVNQQQQPQQIPISLIGCQNSENSENLDIGVKSDEMELLERSIDKLQLTLQERNNNINNINNNSNNININININDSNKDSKASHVPMVSPSNSLCSSSPSQSDLSSASATITDSSNSSSNGSNNNNNNNCDTNSNGSGSTGKSNQVLDIHEIGLVVDQQQSNATINNMSAINNRDQFVGSKEKLAKLINEDPTTDRSTNTATSAL